MESKGFSFIQISDSHITSYRNLIEPMIDSINSENVDFVVATGDIANSSDNIKLAAETLGKIKHKVVVIPGDYDNGKIWIDNFGDRYRSLNIAGYSLEFIDTSFMRHRFAVGWADVMSSEDSEQYEWLNSQISDGGYHIIFSHHPMFMKVKDKHELLCDNLRCVYSGHLHGMFKFYFPYEHPIKHFKYGFAAVPMNFHGNSCYLLAEINDNDDIVNYPKVVSEKRTAW